MSKLFQQVRSILNFNFFMCLVCVLLGALICALTRLNFGWDFTNYHYYNAFAFLNNRMNYDIVPASVNTFFNPLIDLPFYFLVEYFNDDPIIIYGLQGVWFGLLIFAFFKITTLFFEPTNWKNALCVFLTLIIGITAHAVWFQAGSSTNEIQVGFLSLIALYFLFKMIKYSPKQNGYVFLFAGLILGCALGLKSTVIYICLASGLSLLLCYKYLNRPFLYVFVFALGGFVGYLITNGWWMWRMWTLYENPFFPFLNGFFHSPYFDDFNYTDTRFIPPSFVKFIFPYIWMTGAFASAEVNFYDLRGIFYYTVALVFCIWLLSKPEKMRRFFKENKLWGFYFIFMICAYVLWLHIFSIQRYLIVVLLLSAIFFIKLVFVCYPKKKVAQWIYIGCTILIIDVFVSVPLTNKSFGRPNKKELAVYIEPIRLPENTLLKLYSFPTAGVIPVLEKQTDFRALGYIHLNARKMKGSDFVERGKFREMRDKIEVAHKGPIVLIGRHNSVPKMNDIILSHMEKDLVGKCCEVLDNNLDNWLYICVPQELKQQIFAHRKDDEKCKKVNELQF